MIPFPRLSKRGAAVPDAEMAMPFSPEPLGRPIRDAVFMSGNGHPNGQ